MTVDEEKIKALIDSYQTELSNYQTELGEQRKRYRRWLLIFALVAFLTLVLVVTVSLVFIDSDIVKAMQDANASEARNYDYLQFVVPVLLAIGAFMAALLGIDRLRNLDDQIEKIEARFEEDLSKKWEQYVKTASATIDSKISTQIGEQNEPYLQRLQAERKIAKDEMDANKAGAHKEIEDWTKVATGSLHQLCDDAEQRMQQLYDNAEGDMKKTGDLVSDFDKRYGWLKNERGEINSDEITVQSVADAHKMVEDLFANQKKSRDEQARQVTAITQRVLLNQNPDSGEEWSTLPGDKADYHNLTAELARHELKSLAVEVCKRGLEFFPKDEDLLADIILYATQIGEKTAGIQIQTYVDELNKIDKRSWSWRCFEFLSDYYMTIRDYGKAEEICKSYIEFLPRDERGYAEMAEIYEHMYFGQEAEDKKIEILSSAVEKGFACPRCANQLAELYASRGELEKAIYNSNMAILSLAQPQPSVNYAYVFLHKALCEDRLFWKKRLEQNEDKPLAKAALDDYKQALKSNQLVPVTARQAKVRYNLLADMIGEEPYTDVTADDLLASLISSRKITSDASPKIIISDSDE